MRITAGIHRNRQIRTLSGDSTRPTTEKVREAVFSHLGTFFDGGLFLDLFAGSGAMGLEALSRGMERAVLVDNSGEAIRIITVNIRDLKLEEQAEVMKCSCQSALARFKEEGRRFDYIFIDPPYRLQLDSKMCELIAEYDLLATDGIIILESGNQEEITLPCSLQVTKTAVYGISKITYVQRS